MAYKTKPLKRREGNILDHSLVLVLGRRLSLTILVVPLAVVPSHALFPPPRSVGVGGSVPLPPAAERPVTEEGHGIQVFMWDKAIRYLLPLVEVRLVRWKVEGASLQLPASAPSEAQAEAPVLERFIVFPL